MCKLSEKFKSFMQHVVVASPEELRTYHGKYVNPTESLNIRITYGNNTKLGKIPVFDVEPGTTCSRAACETCHIGKQTDGTPAMPCYACAGPSAWKAARAINRTNTDVILYDLDTFTHDLDLFLFWYESSDMGKLTDYRFRFHSRGDFATLDYMLSAFAIAARHPKVKFLAFTKQYQIANNIIDFKPNNFTLIVSGGFGLEKFIPKKLLKLPIAFIIEHACTLKSLLSRKKNAFICPGSCIDCAACWHCDSLKCDIAFNEHGTAALMRKIKKHRENLTKLLKGGKNND